MDADREDDGGGESGDVDRGEEADRFEINLSFAAATCPNCREPRAPGTCPVCGVQIPEVEPSAEERARRQALAPLATEADEVLGSFGDLPEPQVTLGVDQFLTCVVDLDLIANTGRFATLGDRLSGYDFDDPAVVGGEVRRVVSEELGLIRELRDDLCELARFEAEGPALELRERIDDVCRRAAEMVSALLDALVAERPTDVQEATARLQQLLSNSPFDDRFTALLDELPPWMVPNDDARIAALLGREGQFTDDLGQLDFQQIVGVFAEEPEPYKALAEVGAGYFQAAIGPDAVTSDGVNAMLILPATAMATLGRPLIAHRLVRGVHDLIHRAWDVDRAAVEAALEQTVEQAQLILSAANRIQQRFRLLARSAEVAEIDDGTIVAELVEAYRELVETSYRVLGKALLDLAELVAGREVADSGELPMLGTLVDRLRASAEPALQELGRAADVELRNAGAHSQYRWENGPQLVRDLKTGQTWARDELERTVDSVVSALTGTDAAWVCFVAAADVDLTPSWVGETEMLDTTLLNATIAFASHGLNVTAIEDGGAIVVVERPDEIDPQRIVPPLAGMSQIAKDRHRYAIKASDDGQELLAIDGEPLRRSIDAQSEMKDLAVQEVTLNAMINSGRDPGEALLEIAVVNAKVVALTALQELAEDDDRSGSLRRLGRRVNHLHQFVRGSRPKRPEFDRLLDKLRRIAESSEVATDSPDNWRRLCDQLTGLVKWAEKRGVVWPPRMGPE